MQILRLNDVPVSQRDLVFAYSRLRAISSALLLLAVAAGLIIFARLKGAWPVYCVAAFMVLCVLIYQKVITARFHSANWLVRLTDNGLFIKFRSYLNDHFDAQDFVVLFLPFSELRSARMVKERQEVPDRNTRSTTITTTKRILELELAEKTVELAVALGTERERVFGKMPRTNGRMSTRYQHFPVRLASPTLLCIEWGVVPKIQTLLNALTRHTLVSASAEEKKDYTHLESLDRKEQEARLLELAESGDMIGAIAIARKLYSYDLTTAKQFVESLTRK
jgi:hypothetical protein